MTVSHLTHVTPVKRCRFYLKAVVALSCFFTQTACVVAPQVTSQRSELGAFATSELSGSVVVARPLAWTWSSWTRADHVRGFLAPEVAIGEEVGDPFEVYFIPGQQTRASGTRGGVILALEPHKTLAFTWTPAPGFEMHGVETTVRVTFTPLGPLRTRVSVSHAGFYDGVHFDAMRAFHTAFWSATLARYWHYASGRIDVEWPPPESLWPQTAASITLTANHRQSKLIR